MLTKHSFKKTNALDIALAKAMIKDVCRHAYRGMLTATVSESQTAQASQSYNSRRFILNNGIPQGLLK